MPAGDIREERPEPPGTYMSSRCTFSSASPVESVSCFSPSPFSNATEQSAPVGSETRRALAEARVLLAGLAHRPRRACHGRGMRDARPLSPTAPRLCPAQPPPSAGSGRGSAAPVPGAGSQWVPRTETPAGEGGEAGDGRQGRRTKMSGGRYWDGE